MGGAYNLGGFSSQLAADELTPEELAGAYRAAGGNPAELAPPAAPTPTPTPTPAPPAPAPDMSVRRAPGGPAQAIRSYDQQTLGVQNQRIGLAGQGGDESAQTYAERAGIRGQQMDAARATVDDARARVSEGREREAKHRDEAERVYQDLRAHAKPPDRNAVEKVMGVIGSVLALGGNHGAAAGASMMSGLLGSDREGWAAEQQAKGRVYQAALGAVDSDQASERHDLEVAGRIAALDAHYYDAALEQAKEMGLSKEAKRVATNLQLDLREKAIGALRASAASDLRAAGARKKSAAEEYFWRVPLDQLRTMPSQVLGELGQKVLTERTKQDQSYRGGEADIAKKTREASGEAAGGPQGADERKMVRLLGGVAEPVRNLRAMAERGEAPPHPWKQHAPDMLKSEDTLNAEADTQAVADILLRDESGAAIGEHEAEKKKRGWGITSGDPEVRARGLRKMLAEYDARLASVGASGQQAAATFAPGARGMDPGQRQTLPAAAAQPVTMVSPDGKTFQVHPSRVGQLRAQGWADQPVSGGAYIARATDLGGGGE